MVCADTSFTVFVGLWVTFSTKSEVCMWHIDRRGLAIHHCRDWWTLGPEGPLEHQNTEGCKKMQCLSHTPPSAMKFDIVKGQLFQEFGEFWAGIRRHASVLHWCNCYFFFFFLVQENRINDLFIHWLSDTEPSISINQWRLLTNQPASVFQYILFAFRNVILFGFTGRLLWILFLKRSCHRRWLVIPVIPRIHQCYFHLRNWSVGITFMSHSLCVTTSALRHSLATYFQFSWIIIYIIILWAHTTLCPKNATTLSYYNSDTHELRLIFWHKFTEKYPIRRKEGRKYSIQQYVTRILDVYQVYHCVSCCVKNGSCSYQA